MNASAKYVLLSPLNGKLMPLDQVPDDVFAQKILGDGVAIVPEDGKLRSPVDGEISSVAETLHAYGFSTDDGLEILVHFGLNTVELKGEGFKPLVKAGDKVKAGDPVAEIDLDFIKSKGISPITPVLICDGADNLTLEAAEGNVKAGQDVVIALKEQTPEAAPAEAKPAASAPEAAAPAKKKLNFDFFQKLSKALLSVVAIMPAAGLLMSLGKLVQILGGDIAIVMTIGNLMEQLGWAFINNLHILFAVAVGGTWAIDRAGGSFAALISFILINCSSGAILGVTTDVLATEGAVVRSLIGQDLLVSNYFISVLGMPALNMGVFVGIIAGFVGGNVYNKFYNFRKLPDALAFFNGKRFVPIAATFYAVVTSLVLSIVWPLIQTGINNFGIWVAESADTAPFFAPFVYGTLERLLLPFGLHHMLTIPMNHTAFGGEYIVQTGISMGQTVYGQNALWLAWITDLLNHKAAGDISAYQTLISTVTPGRFVIGQMIGSTGLLTGVILAIYRCVDKEKRNAYRPLFVTTVLSAILTGVTEPGEFMFMFCAFPLYVIYAILQGIAFGLSDIINLRLHSFGNIEFLTRVPMVLKAGIGMDIVNYIVSCAVFLGIGFGMASIMIRKFNYATPGRLGNYPVQIDSDKGAAAADNAGQAQRVIELLGGRGNIDLVDACMTRLRVTVKDPNKVGTLEAWKAEGALGLVVKGTGVQAVYGPKADVLKNDINAIL